jgi:hypothetical protein
MTDWEQAFHHAQKVGIREAQDARRYKAALEEIAAWCANEHDHDERWPDCPSLVARAALNPAHDSNR